MRTLQETGSGGYSGRSQTGASKQVAFGRFLGFGPGRAHQPRARPTRLTTTDGEVRISLASQRMTT